MTAVTYRIDNDKLEDIKKRSKCSRSQHAMDWIVSEERRLRHKVSDLELKLSFYFKKCKKLEKEKKNV